MIMTRLTKFFAWIIGLFSAGTSISAGDVACKKVIDSPSDNSNTGQNSVSPIGPITGDSNTVGHGNTTTINNFYAAPKPLSDSEIIDNAFSDINNWKCHEGPDELYFYNEKFLDIKILEEPKKEREEYHDFWVRSSLIKSYKTYFYLLYKGQKIGKPFLVIFVDDYKSLVVQPERWDLRREKITSLSEEKYTLSYYFIKNSREHLLDRIIQKTYLPYRSKRLLFPTFESKEAANVFFETDIKNNKRECVYYLVKQGSWECLLP